MSAMPATLLIVDNDVHVRKLLEVLLRGQGYQTLTAGSGKEALAMVMQHAPDLILLDIQMPDMDGYAVARHFKGNSATANIPIIMLSAQSDQKARIAGLEAGAEDFLGKPIVSTELWLRVRNLLRLTAFGDYQADHSLMLEEQLEKCSTDLEQARTQSDSDKHLLHMTHYDSLTGLPNRQLFLHHIAHGPDPGRGQGLATGGVYCRSQRLQACQ
jgi:Response regulator containing a CheY-like receiver domain and a GGDEF domain